eukprot:TRINITY_DN5091_c0_g1_i2.p1 TRINITY_DN5091_c0_g1~~TRINITY_DN5091_c0_g1_i2.p1  ORF type:complete len:167 (-),score=33.51 TRINITY_DN5091_c0_g1_i2:315-815(-)
MGCIDPENQCVRAGVVLVALAGIGSIMALLCGAPWFSAPLLVADSSHPLTVTLYLTHFTVTDSVSTISFNYGGKDTDVFNVDGGTTQCASTVPAVQGLTIASLVLHCIFLAMFIYESKEGHVSPGFRCLISWSLFLGLALLCSSLMTFDFLCLFEFDVDNSTVSSM